MIGFRFFGRRGVLGLRVLTGTPEETCSTKNNKDVGPFESGIWEFPKIRVPYFGVLIIRILLCRVLY